VRLKGPRRSELMPVTHFSDLNLPKSSATKVRLSAVARQTWIFFTYPLLSQLCEFTMLHISFQFIASTTTA
jgi:hypothetical protein